jgi:hypothetical protein
MCGLRVERCLANTLRAGATKQQWLHEITNQLLHGLLHVLFTYHECARVCAKESSGIRGQMLLIPTPETVAVDLFYASPALEVLYVRLTGVRVRKG